MSNLDLIFSARPFDPYTNKEFVYEGKRINDVWTWAVCMDLGYSGCEDETYQPPCRIVRHGSANVLYQYELLDTESGRSYLCEYNGSYSSEEIFENSAWIRWEEFDINAQGLIVILEVCSSDPFQLRVSDDWGVTFGTPIDVDYLYNLLGAEGYAALAGESTSWSVSVAADKSTGVFYLLLAYLDSETLICHLFLLSSTNGTSWNLVRNWDFEPDPFITYVSLSASNGNIAVVFCDEAYKIICWLYLDGEWSNPTVPDVFRASQVAMSLSGTTALIGGYLQDDYPNRMAVYRSANGSDWGKVLDIFNGDSDLGATTESIRGNDGLFAVTFGGIQYPLSGASWKGSDEIPHDMSGEGASCLCLWISEDDGLTWALVQSPITSDNWGAPTLDITLALSSTITPVEIPSEEAFGEPKLPLGIFNQAIYTDNIAIISRSIFTDHGPITKPALTLQTGSDASIQDATTLYLPTASITPSMVGKYITITGTTSNAGTFKILSGKSALPLAGYYVNVWASFTTPDSSSIGWTIFDPRDGEIADAPSDVSVLISGAPVIPDAVIGLLGQIVLPAAPNHTDIVNVDYCWMRNPVVDFRRLNSKEFRLNNWNRDIGSTEFRHRYRYNNTLIQPSTFVPLDMRAQIDQPLQRDLKYRAYERAYSVALNDPNLLLLNTPNHKIAYPSLFRLVESTFVNYQATVLPEVYPVTPWERHGVGVASIVGTNLVVVDNTTGPAPTGNPIYWSRNIDLTFPHVFATSWYMQINAVPIKAGVFTGIAVGYSDNKKVVVVGFLDNGVTKNIGVLRTGAGNDPSLIDAWIGGLDGSGSATYAPVDLDWSVLRSYRIFRAQTGIITVYIDGSIVPALQVLPDDLPYLEELNDPFNSLQGTFFGSLSREAENTSTWSFVRYTIIPINPLQTAPSIFVSYEGTTPPEEASQPWTPVGFHGTETILGGDYLLLDSTSATDLPSETIAGLISGDFRGFSRIEPLLAESFDTTLDINIALRTFTHGITPNAVLAAIDDGDRLIQLCFFPDKAAPKFSYGGRTFPEDFSPYLWNSQYFNTPPLPGITVSMVGQYLQIADDTTNEGLVYYLDDLEVFSSDNRVVSYASDYIFEFKIQVLDYTPDPVGYVGVMTSVYDSLRTVGVMLEEITGQRYVTFHSDGNPVARFAFDWYDGKFHTYRAVKSTSGDLVSLYIDGIFIGSANYHDFEAPSPAVITGLVSFGSATPLSVQAKSTTLWAYANFWRVNSNIKKFAGIWKGYDSNSLTGYHLPTRITGREAAVNGNALTDPLADFVAAGVLVGDQLVIDSGSNKGVYSVQAVAPSGDVTKLTIPGLFPVQPSVVDYRVVIETDWATPHKYRIVKDPSGGISVFLDATTQPWIHADYSSLDLPSSLSGIARTIAGGLPSILWGAFDPTNISQTSWDYVRFGAVRSQAELGIVPHHRVLNQRNVMASYEHHRTTIPHTHTDFWSEYEGIPPQTDPDLLQNPNLISFTLLNDNTPLVPSTQTYEVRRPTPILISVAGLNRPEDVLNNQGFLLNESEQKIEIIVPNDVLYNSLQVIERTTGESGLIAPFDDEYQLGELSYQHIVCLDYEGNVLPENDPTAITPWTRVSDDRNHQFASAFGGVLTYGTDGNGTRTLYRNNTPLPDSSSLQTEVRFRLKVLQDSSGGLGDSQVRVGFSSPGATVGLAFITSPLGERYVLAVDLNSGITVGGIPFDFLDSNYHDYRLVRDPGSAVIQIFVDS